MLHIGKKRKRGFKSRERERERERERGGMERIKKGKVFMYIVIVFC